MGGSTDNSKASFRFKKILLKSFQKWKRLTLELSPTVTTLVGSSDIGKSSVIRAIRWLCFNRPAGGDFIRHGDVQAMAKLELDDGTTIIRKKGKANVYKLDGKVLKSFGAGKVPDPVADVLQMDDVNFQLQHDAPFWISDSSGIVSKSLNKIVNLEVLDNVLGNVASRLRRTQTEQEICEQSLEEVKRKKTELKWVKRCKADWDDILELNAKKQKATAQRLALFYYVEQLERLEIDSNIELPDTTKLTALRTKLEAIKKRKRSLECLTLGLSEMEKTICESQVEADRLRKDLPKICPMCKRPIER